MPDAHSIGENLGRIFRFLLPGIVIVALAWLSHPSWFCHAVPLDSTHLIVLGIVAITAGNTWYVFHRYVIHQLIDWLLYRCKVPGPRPTTPGSSYHADLAEYVVDSYTAEDAAKRAQEALATRASHVFFMYIVSEAAMVFSFWAQPASIIAQHRIMVLVAGLLGFVGATWQEVITRRIDATIVERHRRARGTGG